MRKDELRRAEKIFGEAQFKEETSYGMPILERYYGLCGRQFVVVKRKSDYVVGAGYDEFVGQWGQGYYGFSTVMKAINFAKKLSRECC